MFYAHVLLILIHFLYDLYSAVYNCCRTVQRKCSDILFGYNAESECEMLLETVNKAEKLPRHVVIVYAEKNDTFLDCVQIIGWCITLGIPYISFFDRNGFLVQNETRLRDEIAKHKPEILEHIIWCKSNTSVRNGIKDCKRKVRVSLLSKEDGKGEIVSLTQELAKAVAMGSIKLEEINEHLLNEKLHLRGIPDPELAVIYGKICSTYGLLPWHTATTEFFMLPTCHSLSLKDFTHILLKYSQCEQRYGK